MAPNRRSKRKTAPPSEEPSANIERKRSASRRKIDPVEVDINTSTLEDTITAPEVPAGVSETTETPDEEGVAFAVAAANGNEEQDVEDPPEAETASPQKKRAKRAKSAKAKTTKTDSATFNQMLFDMILYKSEKGDCYVKAADDEHKVLHQWMKQQRDQYKLYQEDPESSTLTKDQVAVLDYMQFPWLVRGTELWKRNYERLKEFQQQHGHTMVSRGHMNLPKLGDWVTEQRRQYKLKMEGKTSTLTDERQGLLEELGMVWKVRDRPGWDKRYAELLEFKQKHGHAKVPQHYSENRQLGKWVAKQREQHRLFCLGKHSFLTPDRQQQLNSVGFVWNCKGREPVKDFIAAQEAAAPAPVPPPVPPSVEANEAEPSVTAVKAEEEDAVEETGEIDMEVTLETEETLAAEESSEADAAEHEDAVNVAELTLEAVATATAEL